MKKNNTSQKGIGFSLVNIITKQFATIPENYKAGNKDTYATTTNFGIDTTQKVVEIVLEIRLKQGKGIFMICQIACYFSIEEEAWANFLVVDTEKIAFPRSFMTHLVVLTVGTIRGFLHAKTENTNLNGFVLPTLNVTTIVKNDIVFTIQ